MTIKTQAQHTPGPWKAEKYCIWANNHNGSVYIAGTQTGIDTDKQEANARLIAAAPDLLAACEALMELLGQMGPSTGDPKRFKIRVDGAEYFAEPFRRLETAVSRAKGAA